MTNHGYCCDVSITENPCDPCKKLFIFRAAEGLKKKAVYLLLDVVTLRETNKPTWSMTQIASDHPRLDAIRQLVHDTITEK